MKANVDERVIVECASVLNQPILAFQASKYAGLL